MSLRKKTRRSARRSVTPFLAFLVGAFFLFLNVWFAIQAERAGGELVQLKKEIARKKSVLRDLNERHMELTSLTQLDRWAKKTGPWVSPNAGDIIALQS